MLRHANANGKRTHGKLMSRRPAHLINGVSISTPFFFVNKNLVYREIYREIWGSPLIIIHHFYTPLLE